MSDLNTLCLSIYDLQVDRKFAINLQTKILNTAAANIVSAIGLERDADDAERKQTWGRALRIVAAAMKAVPAYREEDRAIGALQDRNLKMLSIAMAPIDARRLEVETEMARLAISLPGAACVIKQTAGINALGIAVIVGEAGSLSNYATKCKLWRRLGYGMAPGHEQHAYSTHRRMKDLSADDWVRAGYSPKRLGQIYGVVTIPLFMAKAKNKYGPIYERRRARTLVTHPEWYADKNGKPKINKNGEPSSAHAMEDGKRIMTKAFLSDLWSEWRRAVIGVSATTSEPLPSAASSDPAQAGEPQANIPMRDSATLVLPTATSSEDGRRSRSDMRKCATMTLGAGQPSETPQ